MRIPGLRGLPVGEVARDTWRGFQEDDMWTFAAALACHALFALFPFLPFLVAAFSFLDAPELFEWPHAGAVQVDTDAADELRDGLLAQAGVRARRADLRAVEARVDALGRQGAIDEGVVRVAVEHGPRVLHEQRPVELLPGPCGCRGVRLRDSSFPDQ